MKKLFYAPPLLLIVFLNLAPIPSTVVAQNNQDGIYSPYYQEARFSTKQSIDWIGYKVYLTEICDEDAAHLIITRRDDECLLDIERGGKIQQDLAQKQLLPTEHLIDRSW
ncbi:MAG: hypothetical protein ACLGJB_03570 [Blastocatellia bacterium]